MEQNEASSNQDRVSALILKRTYELLTSAFALVAALAWNDAVQSTFNILFKSSKTLPAKFLYALLVTVLVVWMGIRLAKLTSVIEKKVLSRNTTKKEPDTMV